MTYDQIYDHATELNGGNTINDTLFSQLVKTEKGKIERMRNWQVLKELNQDLSVTSANTPDTQHTIPTRYIRGYGRYPVRLISADNAEIECLELPLALKHKHRLEQGYFFVDKNNGVVYFSGSFDRTFTVQWDMIRGTADLDASGRSPAEWEFDEEWHPLLAARVVLTHKGGVDIDEVNARMTAFHGRDVQEMISAMVDADAWLERNHVINARS